MKINFAGFVRHRREIIGIATTIVTACATYWLLQRWDVIKAMIARIFK